MGCAGDHAAGIRAAAAVIGEPGGPAVQLKLLDPIGNKGEAPNVQDLTQVPSRQSGKKPMAVEVWPRCHGLGINCKGVQKYQEDARHSGVSL